MRVIAIFKRISTFFSTYFTVLVILATICAISFKGLSILLPAVKVLLSIIMFAMGLTIKPYDFIKIFKFPKALLLGIILQYTVMPCIAILLIATFPLNSEIATGVILLGCSPGGTASNVMTYIAKGDVALSVSLTTFSTLISPIVTPLLIYLLAHSWITIDVLNIFFSISQIVLIPVILGIIINVLLKDRVNFIYPTLPTISIISIIIIIIAVVAANTITFNKSDFLLIIVVILHNIFGLLLGYYISKLFKLDIKQCRTISLEVGLQNSALASTLAVLHFNPLSALPGAIYSIWHNISGSYIATKWAKMLK